MVARRALGVVLVLAVVLGWSVARLDLWPAVSGAAGELGALGRFLARFAAPALEPGGAILHTLYSEVCGTDVHLHAGKLSGVPYPLIPGHVSVGVIAVFV